MPFLTQDVQGIVSTLMEGLDTPRSLAVKLLVDHGEWSQVANLDLDPRRYTTAPDYWRDSMATEFLRKCADFSDVRELAQSTLNKWYWAEAQCRRTNLRLDYLDLPTPCLTESEVAIQRVVRRARKVVLDIIGSAPPQFLPGRFGPGATVSDPSNLASIPDKMSSVPTFTPNAWLELVPWAGTAWASASAALGKSPKSVRGNVYFTVPKSAKSLRACAKEPSINGYFQLGVGSFLKDCLRSKGIDLYHGQSVHRELARSASLHGHLSTVDLTSASDTIATSLVKLLLPPKWFALLSRLRSPFTYVDGKWVYLEKFSSMGNGFTFELETLIFLSIIQAVRPELERGITVHVYGDDIIIPTDATADVLSALRYFGFTPNMTKTHIDGPFRESCGGDYFQGRSVRAAYLEELPYEPQHFISLANSLRRACEEAEVVSLGRFSRVMRSWFRTLDCLPVEVRRCRGPKGLGDQVVHDTEDRWITRWRSSIRYIRCYRPQMTHVIRWDGFAYDVQFASALYHVPTNLPTKIGRPYPSKIFVGSRSSSVSYKVGWTPHS